MLTCPSCGRQSLEGFAFCPHCGTQLPGPASAGQEERKVVSVLFCDLVGFTASSDQADPEDVRAILRPYHQRVRREIERVGGTVEKFIGDAVMAVFGAPVAHEDDAQRAVLAGLRVLDAIPELNEADPRLNLAVRIGVNTGDAVVSVTARPEAGEGIATGDVVNTAARLQQGAPIGAIVVGEMTYRMTKDVFAYEELAPVEAKGKGSPIPLWKAVGRKRLGIEADVRPPTPFVGREDDLALMRQTFQRSLREGSVQLVTIIGEPGVGKSRLIGEFRNYVDELPEVYHWRQGRCLSYGEGITFWALGEIVKAQAGILESDSPEVAASKLKAAVPESKEQEWLFQRLLPLVGLEASSSGDREELFAAWRTFLETLAEERAAVLIFEDLHWADDALLDFLEYLAEWTEGLPILLVASARPEILERRPGWGGGTRNALTVNLSPLSKAETASLISVLLDSALLPADVQSRLLERVGGNPLYAEEFVRLLGDRGLLIRKGGTYGLADGAEVVFPDTIQALIAARLDTLSPERKALLQDAAVIGKVFWSGALAAMGGVPPRTVFEAMHELSRKELVRPARVSSMEGESEYSFWHVLVRDVAYSQIPRARRADNHRRVAAWIESRAGDRVEDHAEILAHHYTEALDLARAAGQIDRLGELEDQALRFLVLAGDRALGLDTAKAEAYFNSALERAPVGHTERAVILVRWADAVRQRGRQTEAGLALEEAVSTFRSQGRNVEGGRAMTLLANVLWFQGDPKTREVIAEAVTVLESEPPGRDLLDAYAEAARLGVLSGDNTQGMAWADRAIALASELGLPEPARALGYRGLARHTLGDPSGAHDLKRALSLALDSGQGLEAAILYNNLASIEEAARGPAASLPSIRATMEFCERRGLTRPMMWSATNEQDARFELGMWDGLVEAADELAEKLEATGSVATLVPTRALQARVLVHRGRVAEAAPLAEWAIAAARDSVQVETFIQTREAGALSRLATGDAAGAGELLIELERTPHVRSSSNYVGRLPSLMRSAVAAGDVPLAQSMALGIESRNPREEHSIAATAAVIAEALGEPERAAGLYADAAERWKDFEMGPEEGFARLGHGRSLAALGRTAEAAEPLRRAREIFGRLQANSLLAETDELLEYVTALTS